MGVVASGETASATDITYCALMLNAMLKAWQGQGIHLWTEEEGTLYLVYGQAQYSIPGAHAGDGSGTPVETTISTSGAALSSSVVVVNAVGMTIGDTIGISQDNNVMTWGTISNISGNTVTFSPALTYAASNGNLVATYTTACPRPLSIQDVRLRDNNNFDRPMQIKPRVDYQRIPEKFTIGNPIILFYSPQLTAGVVSVWPTPTTTNQRIKFTYLRSINDLNTGSDLVDFPQEWLETITFNLSVRVAPAYGINLNAGGYTGNPSLVSQAAQYLEELKAWDSEQPYMQFVPNYRYR